MHKYLFFMVFLTVLTLGMGACGPDNVAECEAAQAALDDAYEACELEPISLDCPSFADKSGDCTDFFSRIADSATCTEDGDIDYDSSGVCV